jgi:hypothetical protein
MTIEVPAESMVQRPLPPGTLGEMAVSVHLLEPEDSHGFWTAYGSSVDNSTGDAWLRTAVPAGEIAGASQLLIPSYLNGPDGNGLAAFTRMNVTNHSQDQLDVGIGFTPSGEFCYGDVCNGTGFTLGGRSSVTIFDSVGMMSLGGFGSIILDSATPVLTATYRTSSVLPGRGSGTVGRSGEAIDLGTLPGDDVRRIAIGVRHDQFFTCRVGIWAEWYGSRRFLVTATSDEGSVMIDVSVAGYSVAEVALPKANLGYVTVTVEPLDALPSFPATKWTAYAISFDNRSGDSWVETAWPQ